MGHNIQHYDYPENVDQKKVFRDLANYVQHEAWQEGGHLNEIRWLDAKPLPSRDDAEAFLDKHDKGWYDCLAVRYLEIDRRNPTRAYAELLERRRKAYGRFATLNGELYISTISSGYVGCKNCGSKMNRAAMLKGRSAPNRCPVCGAELRPASKLERIENARKAVDEIDRKLAEEERRMAKRNGAVRWLVKIEFHT